MITTSRIVIGTAQFGLNYGITNKTGKVDLEEVISILDLASQHGITVLDSASSYGNSEEVIGKAVQALGKAKNFSVITKIYLESFEDIRTQVYSQIEKTLMDLNGINLHSLMIHQGHQLLNCHDKLISVLADAKREFSIPKIGSSVYDLAELMKVSELMPLEIIQIPYNVLNQNIVKGRFIADLKIKGCEVHARSIFLQGSLLASKDEQPEFLKKFPNEMNKYYNHLEISHLTALEFNLFHALGNPYLDSLVLGVISVEQLQEIIEAFEKSKSITVLDLKDLNSTNENLINPAKWNLK